MLSFLLTEWIILNSRTLVESGKKLGGKVADKKSVGPIPVSKTNKYLRYRRRTPRCLFRQLYFTLLNENQEANRFRRVYTSGRETRSVYRFGEAIEPSKESEKIT